MYILKAQDKRNKILLYYTNVILMLDKKIR